MVMRAHAYLRTFEPLVKVLPVLGFSCGLFGVVSYICTDMMSLRLFSILNGAIAAIFYFLQPVPIWVSIFWNLMFFGINAVQVAILLAKTDRTFTEKEMDLYRHFTQSMTVKQFGTLLSCGATWKTAAAGETIMTEGQEATRILLLAAGEVNVSSEKHEVCEMGPGAVFGEIALMTAATTYATTVVAARPCEYVEFTHEGLAKLDSAEPELKQAMNKLLHTGLAEKFMELVDHQVEATEEAENRMYRDMLRVVSAGYYVSSTQTAMLEEIRKEHGIAREQKKA